MELDFYPKLTTCEISFKDDSSSYSAKLAWEEAGALFHDIVTEAGNDEMDVVCIDRVMDLLAAYFDSHCEMTEREYSVVLEGLNKIKETLA